MMVADRKPLGSVVIDQPARHRNGFIGRIVEHLNVELLQRIVQAANRIQQPLDHELLVEDWELDGDAWQFRKMRGRFGRAILLVLVIEINQDVAMRAIRRQQDQHDEIRNQQRRVEGVGVIEALKSLVEKMLANVLPDPLRGDATASSGREKSIFEQIAFSDGSGVLV